MTHHSVHPVDEKLPLGRLTALGLQHVLVMYAGAIAVPLIVGRALKLSPEEVTMLISADLFCCGLVTLIQSFGLTSWFGIRLPVMMGVTFAAVGPMVAIATAVPGVEGARAIFGAGIGAGALALLIAPLMSRMLRFFPPVVTGTIILVIGISLMRVGVGWAMGGPDSLAQNVDTAKLIAMVDQAKASAGAAPVMKLSGPIPMVANPGYGALDNMAIAGFVLLSILLLVRYTRGFIANISVLLGIVAGCAIAIATGKMHFDKVGKADWFQLITPFAFGMPTFDIVMILTITVVMIVVMIESAGMFLALSDMTCKKIDQAQLAAGLRTDGLGTLIGGIFNSFPHTSFSQNVGLVAVTGVKSRWVCVAGGIIMIVLGMLPKMAALVEAIPQFVLGGAGLVMFGMVAASGIRILSRVDFRKNRFNLYIVAVSVGFGLVPLVAPHWAQQMEHNLHPLLDSGILLTAVAAVAMNLFFNGTKDIAPEAHHEEAGAAEHSIAQGSKA
ncbi:nucleobase:cation symporter-2 family protein [Massilia horti]|uniref:Purine permease n=1 Tax=Massilia horti TaxID=2562153 RepID=A0A4Y9SM42_9BURK|nr:nucleobase:cation symporter-2 family protein [Massilia horti]TFW27742.1 purine permease [Massilia horti]